MNRFEYKLLDVPTKGFFGGKVDNQELVEKLNELGAEGWEVVSTTDTNMHQGASRALIILLKRQLDNR